MALVFDARSGNTPSTHALVIGVGGYRHLPGGADQKTQTLVEHVGLLQQLTSPPRSAVAFVQWLLEAQNAWAKPVGSIDLLVSPAPAEPNPLPHGLAADAATIQNIQAAYDAWKARCERHEDNIALFYFCGHGVEKKEQILLAEDFGANPNNPWLGSFAFDSTRMAFQACRAKTQCFFVDACRKITSGMLTREPRPIALDVVDVTASECEFNLTMKGSAHNESALGPRRGVAYFTQALIRALCGGAATSSGADWRVETAQVSAKITEILRMVKRSEGFAQRCSSQVTASTPILRVTGVPKVELVLTCKPEEANALAAQLTCRRVYPPGLPDLHNQSGPWTVEVDAGMYLVEASFAPGSFRAEPVPIMATPPRLSPFLECSR